MKSFSRAAIVGLICAVGLSFGCAKPDDNKRDAVAGANAAFADLKSSMDEANSMGAPSANWSDDKLAAYTDLMTRIEASANRAQTFDGKSGIVIKETDGLAEAKESAANGRLAVKKVHIQRRWELIRGLRADIETMSQVPNSSWSPEAVATFERVADHAESTGKQLAFRAELEVEKDLAEKVATLVQIQRSAIEAARKH